MATKQQVPVIAARLVEFQEEFSNLSTEDAQWAIINGKEAAALSAKAIANYMKAKNEARAVLLSNVIYTFSVPATTEKFVVKDNFKVDISKMAKVKISYLSVDFQRWFSAKVEHPFAGSKILGRKLENNSIDGPIIYELGGQEKAEITLAEIYAMMTDQFNGKNGCLLNNEWANIFYVNDVNGTLRTVFVAWVNGGWRVGASSIEDHYKWMAYRLVFARDFQELRS